MLSVANKPIVQSVIMLSVVMLNVVVPLETPSIRFQIFRMKVNSLIKLDVNGTHCVNQIK
jgi:hypothetical protein